MINQSARQTIFLLLAAGASRRFGMGNKLLAPLGSGAVMDTALGLARSFPWAGAIGVCRPESLDVRGRISSAGLTIADNPDANSGMGSSIGAGMRAAQALKATPDAQQVMIVPADLPFLALEDVAHLLKVSATAGDPQAVRRLSFRGQGGHPVLFGRSYFGVLAALREGPGAGALIPPERLQMLARPTDGCVCDLDTKDALAGAQRRLGQVQHTVSPPA